MSSAKQAGARKRPWRDNIEAVTMALVMAVMLKYFIVEAYKIPTGSMQPTLLGNDETNVYDRILVDKSSYHFRDPERFEVAVFRYPLDRSKSFIKRVVGMPDEDFRILYGDLWARKDASEEWRVLRRGRPVQREMLKRLASAGDWRVEGASRGWEVDGDEIRAAGEGSARFPRERSSVKDHYADGYPGKMASKLQRFGAGSGLHDVGDLEIAGTIEARADCTAVEIEFHEGALRHRVRLPGPAAPEDATIELVSELRDGGEPRSTRGGRTWRLPAGRRVAFEAHNLDDLLEVEVEGVGRLALEVSPTADQSGARLRLSTLAGGAHFRDLAVWRDVYYTAPRSGETSWHIPPDCYFMMGDNTQDSADSREWRFVRYRVGGDADDGLVLRGNLRDRENPVIVPHTPSGQRIFLRDEWGERHVLAATEAVRIADEPCPFVPRELMMGRALVVFWPFVPSLGIYRLKWIH